MIGLTCVIRGAELIDGVSRPGSLPYCTCTALSTRLGQRCSESLGFGKVISTPQRAWLSTLLVFLQ